MAVRFASRVANRKSCAMRKTHFEISGLTAQYNFCPGAGLGPAVICLDGHHVVCARTFLSLANVKLDCLAIIQRCVIIAAFDFRMVYEKILATIFGCNESISFSGVEPLDCTFTHTCTSLSIDGEK